MPGGDADEVRGVASGDITMLGAIAGAIIGSAYEARPIWATRSPLSHSHCRFTDDTVLTVPLRKSHPLRHQQPYCGFCGSTAWAVWGRRIRRRCTRSLPGPEVRGGPSRGHGASE